MRRVITGLILAITLCMTARTQTTFSTDGLDYALDLPSASWTPVSRVDVHEHFEFINGDDHSNGYLRLRKKLVPSGTVPEVIFLEDEKRELARLPGYIVCDDRKGVTFAGHLQGRVFSYEYVNAGMNMEGRIYYLQVDNRTFYTLHFTVAGVKLRSLRDQMDSMARSFRLK